MLPEPAEVLITAAQDAQTQKFVLACVAALFIYDYVITLSDEIELIWPSTWSITEVVFYAARYTAWLEIIEELIFWYGDLDEHKCKIFGGYHAFSVVIGMVMSQTLIIVRTWAIWNGARVIKISYTLFCFSGLVFCAYLSAEWMENTTFHMTVRLAPWLHGCAISTPYRLIYVGWVLSCGSDLVLIGLTAVKGWQQRSARLTVLLYRDAFVIFSFVLVLAIANLSVTLVAAEHYQVLLYGFERMLYTILACRMMLNLRSIARDTVTSETLAEGLASTGQAMHFRREHGGTVGDDYQLSRRDPAALENENSGSV